MHRNPAQLEQPPNRVLDQVVWAARAGGDAHGDGAGGQPVGRRLLDVRVLVPVPDERGGLHLRGVLDEVGRQHLLAHLGEVRGVRRVVATHHQQQVELRLQQLLQCVLPVLRRATDGVEEAEVLIKLLSAVFLFHRGLEAALHLLGLAAQHRGLVRHAHRHQMQVGVEAR